MYIECWILIILLIYFTIKALQPQPHLTEMLETTVENFKFDHPIVGVHIRRTDKVGTEAAFHPVEEYMVHVEEWFRKQRLKDPTIKSKVYIGETPPPPLLTFQSSFF